MTGLGEQPPRALIDAVRDGLAVRWRYDAGDDICVNHAEISVRRAGATAR